MARLVSKLRGLTGLWILLTFWPAIARGATLLIVTDQASGARAEEIKQLFEKTPPFSLLVGFKVAIRVIQKNAVKCVVGAPASSPGVNDEQRVDSCTFGPLFTKLTAEENADRVLFVQENLQYGGAGGQVATVTTTLPLAGSLHELLHTFGLADEYPYTQESADKFCPLYVHAPNLALFNDAPPYSSDQDARNRHAAQIPWFSMIQSATPLTAPGANGLQLGTPGALQVIGLFPGTTCDKKTLPVKSWVPGGSQPRSKGTVMKILSTTYISEAVWPVVAEGMHTSLNVLQHPTPTDYDIDGTSGEMPDGASPAK